MTQQARFIVESLDRKKHDRAAFDCGVPELNLYLQQSARQDKDRGAAAVYVLRELALESRSIAGYYTLSATIVELVALPPEIASTLPRYGTLPAALIGRLALDKRYQGQGAGGFLLTHALKHALRLSRNEIGITAVVVDAKDDRARTFYENYGFLRDLRDEYRLLLPISTVAQAFGDIS